MQNTILSCFTKQQEILNQNKERLLTFLSKIANDYPALKAKYSIDKLVIVNHETKFFQSVSALDTAGNWVDVEGYEEDLGGEEVFGLWDYEFEIADDPIPDLMWTSVSMQLNEVFSLWLLETAAQSAIKELEEAVFYSADCHFEAVWNLKNWKGPVDVSDINRIME